MKKFILVISVVTALAESGYCQADTLSPKINSGYISYQYLIKAKNKKTAAWICLGGGITLTTTGFMLASTKAVVDFKHQAIISKAPTSNYVAETVLALVGVAGITASIPLFIASANNSKKATLMITLQTTAKGLPPIVSKNVTGLTLSITI